MTLARRRRAGHLAAPGRLKAAPRRFARPAAPRPAALTAAALLAAALLAAAAPAAGQAIRNGPLPQPLPLFPADNWWNADVSQAPVDPASDAILDSIGRDRSLHPDFGGDAPDVPEIYGMPYASVPGDQPLVPVNFVEYGDESDAGAPGRPPGYPIPPAARFEPRWIEGGHPGAEAPGGDRHLLIVDRDNRLLYELYHARWNVAMARWEAGSGAVWPLDENRRRPEGWTSADAAGLAILPGLVRWDEVFGPAPIRHAFRFTVPRTNGHVFPASHRAGDTPGAPPLGLRLRLKSSVDLSPYPPEVRRIFQAMKTHGLILADNGSAMFVQGTYDPRWDNDVLNPAFGSLRAGDFEVIERGWQPAAGGGGPGEDDEPPPEPCAAGATTLCLGPAGRYRVEAAWRTADGGAGAARALPLTADTGAFWFFAAANVELLVKVLAACPVNGHAWVFAAGLTDVEVELTVTDTGGSGGERVYRNPQRTAFQPVQDTAAFGCGG